MGKLTEWPLDLIRGRIEKSNRQSMQGSQKYVYWEQKAIARDYEFIPCPCDESCWCRHHECKGHYRIRNIGFENFLSTFVTLWIPPRARGNVSNAVLYGASFNGRQKGAVPALQWLGENWDTLIDKARRHTKMGLCTGSAFKLPNVDNLYQAKMWSQLFYDSAVPFDTESKKRMKRSGYTDPIKDFPETNSELFGDLRHLADTASLSMADVRNLDCPSRVDRDLKRPMGGQPLSRILDKIFYIPL